MTDHKPFHENCWLITYWMFNHSVIRALDPDNPRDREILCDLQDRRPAPDVAALHYTERSTVEPFSDSSYDNEEGLVSSRGRRRSSKRRRKLSKSNPEKCAK